MNKFVSCICVCLALVVAVMPLCAFKCADVPNAPAMLENRPVMASNRPLVEPVVEPPLSDFVLPEDFVGTRFVINLDLSLSDFMSANYTLGHFAVKGSNSGDIVITNAITGQVYNSNTSYINFGRLTSNAESLKLSANGLIDVSSGVYYIDFLTTPLAFEFYYRVVDASSYVKVNLLLESDFVAPINSSFFYVYVPEPEPTVIEQLIDILVAGIGTFGTNIGQGLTDIVVNVFVDTSQETFALTTFGGVVAVFAGLALAVGLSKLVTSFIMRLGGKE